MVEYLGVVDHTSTSRSGSRSASGRSSAASTALKSAVVRAQTEREREDKPPAKPGTPPQRAHRVLDVSFSMNSLLQRTPCQLGDTLTGTP